MNRSQYGSEFTVTIDDPKCGDTYKITESEWELSKKEYFKRGCKAYIRGEKIIEEPELFEEIEPLPYWHARKKVRR